MGYCKAHQLDMRGFCGKFDCPCIKHNCRFFGVKTNADRIRAMSDDLLATQLVQVVKETIKALTELDLPDEISSEIRLNLLEKLKQPAEE